MKRSKLIQSNKRNQKEEGEEEVSQEIPIITVTEDEQTRIVGLYGAVEEEKCAAVISVLYHMRALGKRQEPVNEEEPEGEMRTVIDPIEFMISTEGGLVSDMFSVYDVMRDIMRDCEISTFGLGKVMSAGVILLAAGTPGKRRVGKHCRLMLHPISSGNYGQIHDLENNFKEINILQEMYIRALCELSGGKLTEKKLKELFKKKVDTYFDAQQALEWGIIDQIV